MSRAAPDAGPSGWTKTMKETRCRYYFKGGCDKYDRCEFSHDCDGDGNHPGIAPIQQPCLEDLAETLYS